MTEKKTWLFYFWELYINLHLVAVNKKYVKIITDCDNLVSEKIKIFGSEENFHSWLTEGVNNGLLFKIEENYCIPWY